MTATTEATTATIDTAAFKAALAKFVGVVPTKSRRPELTDAICLTAKAATGEVVLSSTNLDQALRLATPATVEADAALVVSYKDLKAATGAVKSDRLTVDFAADAAAVFDTSAALTGRAHVVTAVEGYPTVLCGAPTATFSIPAGELGRGMRAVLPGVAKGDTRYSLNGVSMAQAKSGDGIELCASNTHLLYLYTIPGAAGEPLPGPNDGNSPIIPPDAAEWLSKRLPAGEADRAEVCVTNHEVYFACDGWEYVTRRIEGMFPRYWDVIPHQSPGQLTVNRREFLDVLKIAKPAADAETRAIDIVPTEDDTIVVRARKGGEIAYAASLAAAARKCPRVIFNVTFLVDFLSAVSSEFVTFRFGKNGHEDPAIATSGNLVFVLMPINPDRQGDAGEELKAANAAYRATLAEPDQDFPSPIQAVAACASAKRPPSYKAVVAAAKADPGYLSSLLAALGVSAAAH